MLRTLGCASGRFLAVAVFCIAFASIAWGQGPATLPSEAAIEAPAVAHVTSFESGDRHKFLDNKNRVLFVGVAALNSADFAVTRANLQNGGTELNPLTRPFSHSTAALAANFAGETAGVVALSYFFHKTGHHKLERLVSLVSMSESGAAVGYGLLHR
jgi:hypothetical protein